jgi:UDP-N-acetylenolpyruvoylglucosamine reductase
VTRPGATAADVHGLIVEVQQRVLAATGIRLRPEVTVLGDLTAPPVGETAR